MNQLSSAAGIPAERPDHPRPVVSEGVFGCDGLAVMHLRVDARAAAQ
jgi:hypothetical protein